MLISHRHTLIRKRGEGEGGVGRKEELSSRSRRRPSWAAGPGEHRRSQESTVLKTGTVGSGEERRVKKSVRTSEPRKKSLSPPPKNLQCSITRDPCLGGVGEAGLFMSSRLVQAKKTEGKDKDYFMSM